MTTDRQVDRADLLVADLERVPEVLRALAPAVIPGAHAARRVVLTGLGSSRFAALAVAHLLRNAGLDVIVEHASASRPAPVGPGTLVVGISSSGSTLETVAAVSRARAAGAATIAVTNRPGSALAAAAEVTLPLGAGTEASGIASTSYVATVAVLIGLARALGAAVDVAAVIADGADATGWILATRNLWLMSAAEALDGGKPIHVLADTAALGTAEQAALLFREGPRLNSDATDAGDWLHVGIYTALPGYRALLLSGTAYDRELVGVVTGRGGRVVAVGPGVVGAQAVAPLPAGAANDPLVRALVEPVITALIAAELWRRTRATDAILGA